MHPKKSVGRPRGENFPLLVRGYENEEGMRLLSSLAQQRGVSVACLLRLLVREEAARRAVRSGNVGGDWSQAAAEMREYYEKDPEVQEWLDADDGFVEPEEYLAEEQQRKAAE